MARPKQRKKPTKTKPQKSLYSQRKKTIMGNLGLTERQYKQQSKDSRQAKEIGYGRGKLGARALALDNAGKNPSKVGMYKWKKGNPSKVHILKMTVPRTRIEKGERGYQILSKFNPNYLNGHQIRAADKAGLLERISKLPSRRVIPVKTAEGGVIEFSKGERRDPNASYWSYNRVPTVEIKYPDQKITYSAEKVRTIPVEYSYSKFKRRSGSSHAKKGKTGTGVVRLGSAISVKAHSRAKKKAIKKRAGKQGGRPQAEAKKLPKKKK